MPGKLYVVATPIGNREDITDRAKRILETVDIIAAEDTRTSSQLLKTYNIQNRMVSNHRFNEKSQVDYLMSMLTMGKNIAIISDAGTPCISDPGCVLVKTAVEHGINVEGICGPSAVITALSICGFSCLSFAFYGFLPRASRDIRERLKCAEDSKIPVAVFYESPVRILKTIEIISQEYPNAALCVCNDMTKKFERVYRGTPSEVLQMLKNNPDSTKGEYTFVVNFPHQVHSIANDEKKIALEALIVDRVITNNISIKEALAELTNEYKGIYARSEFYAASLNLKKVFGN